MDVILKKPIEKDGQKIEKLNLDLGSITGIDILKAEKEAFMSGGGSFDPLFTLHGLAIVASRASGLGLEDMRRLGAPDFLKVVINIRYFLNEHVGVPLRLEWGGERTGKELRKYVKGFSKKYCTSSSYWLNMPVIKFSQWVYSGTLD